MTNDKKTGQRTGSSAQPTVARDGPLVRSVSRPVGVRAAQSQIAIPVFDTSSSMAGSKIDEANAAGTALAVELADPKNRDAFWIGEVVYANEARVHLAPKRATEVRPEELAVKTGIVGSWTNITAGLTTALGLVEQSLQSPGNWARPVVVLLTDGQHNTGPSPETVAATLKTKADLLAVAFGADADLAMLERLATSPQHALRCVSAAELRKFFQAVGRTMSQAARTGSGQSVAALLGQGGVLRG